MDRKGQFEGFLVGLTVISMEFKGFPHDLAAPRPRF